MIMSCFMKLPTKLLHILIQRGIIERDSHRHKFLTCHFSELEPKQNLISDSFELIQPAITCSKLTIETVEQGVKYVQSYY